MTFLTILSFPHFFFFLPNFSNGNRLLAFVQIISQVGWVMFTAVPPLIFLRKSQSEDFGLTLLFIAIGIWPISTLTIKIILLVETQSLYLEYLISYPVFIFMEFFAPLVYLYFGIKLKRERVRK
jgi:hypothetical protein